MSFVPIAASVLALGGVAGLVYGAARPRPMDRAEDRRKCWKVLPDVELPDTVECIRSEFMTSKGIRLFVVEFQPKNKPSKGVICVCHGYCDQIDWLWYPRCIKLCEEGYTVIGLDLEGHGRSDGILAYIPSFPRLVEGAFEVFQSKRNKYNNQKWILAGESMGGAVALWMVLQFGQDKWDGLWLMCPMCKISDELTPPKVVVEVLTRMSNTFPTWPIVPSENIVDKAYRNKKYADLVKASPFYVDYNPRIMTALQLLKATQYIDANMEKITIPYVLIQGEGDTVTDPRTCAELLRRSQSADKTYKLYPGIWHGIYEDPDGAIAWKDTCEWLAKHT